jgi:flagellar basal body-associated protein FliL
MEEGKKKIVIQVAIFVVVFAIAFFGTKYVMSGLTSTESILEATSKEMNQKCPMMLTPEIRLDSTDANIMKGKASMLYVCTLINVDLQDKNFNPDVAEKKTKLAAQKDYESNPYMEKARERNVIIYYVCYDKRKTDILGFEITETKK